MKTKSKKRSKSKMNDGAAAVGPEAA